MRSRPHRLLLLIAACACALLVLPSAAAATPRTWTGPFNGEWNTAGNWSPAGVPGAGDDVTLNVGAEVVIGTGNAVARSINAAGSLTVNSGRTLTIGLSDYDTSTDIHFTGAGTGDVEVLGQLVSEGALLNVDSTGGGGYLYLSAANALAGALEFMTVTDARVWHGDVDLAIPSGLESINVVAEDGEAGWGSDDGQVVGAATTFTFTGAGARYYTTGSGTKTFASNVVLASGGTFRSEGPTVNLTGLLTNDGTVEATGTGVVRPTNVAPADLDVAGRRLLGGEWKVGGSSGRIDLPIAGPLEQVNGATVTYVGSNGRIARIADSLVDVVTPADGSGSVDVLGGGRIAYTGSGSRTILSPIAVGATGTLSVSQAFLTIDDPITTDGGTVEVLSAGRIIGFGVDSVSTGSSTSSSIVVASGAAIDALVDLLAGTATINGNVTEQLSINGYQGTLTGSGNLDSLNASTGTIRPGTGNTGTLIVGGNATLAANAEVHIRRSVAGSTRLMVQGTLTVNPSTDLVIDTSGGVMPAFPSTYSVVTGSPMTGTFPAPTITPALAAPWTYKLVQNGGGVSADLHETQLPVAPSIAWANPPHATTVPNNDNTILFNLGMGSDAHSGLAGYRVRWSQVVVDAPTGTEPIVPHSGSFASTTSPVLADGEWYAHVASVDNAGNMSTSVSVGPFVIDTVAPAAPAIGGAPLDQSTLTTVDLTVTGEAGATFECSLDGAAFSACTSPVSLGSLALGAHEFRARAVDAAGNVSGVSVRSWSVVAPPMPPVDPTPTDPTPTNPTPIDPAPTTPKPVAPRAPAAGQIKLVGAPKLAVLGRSGSFAVTFPIAETGVRVTAQLAVSAKQARVLGLMVPTGARTVTVGTADVTTTRAGAMRLVMRLTRPAKTAFARAGVRDSAVTRVATSLRLTLAKSSLTSGVAKPLAFLR